MTTRRPDVSRRAAPSTALRITSSSASNSPCSTAMLGSTRAYSWAPFHDLLKYEGLLHSIQANRAKVVVMNITGVPTVDSRGATHLHQEIAAARCGGRGYRDRHLLGSCALARRADNRPVKPEDNE